MKPFLRILFIIFLLLSNIVKIFAQNNSELNYSYEEIEKKIEKSHDSESKLWKWINIYLLKSVKYLTFKHVRRIDHIAQEKPLRRGAATRARQVAAFNDLAELLRGIAPAPHVDQRPDQRPHHVAQETVGTDRKAEHALPVGRP